MLITAKQGQRILQDLSPVWVVLTLVFGAAADMPWRHPRPAEHWLAMFLAQRADAATLRSAVALVRDLANVALGMVDGGDLTEASTCTVDVTVESTLFVR